jgi:putative heme-binding domain-containing protein
MLRRISFALLFALALRAVAQTPEWIWGPTSADNESRHFRKTFTAPADVQRALLVVAADNAAEVKLDGKVVGKNAEWSVPSRVNLNDKLAPGEHTLEIAAKNQDGLAGLLVRLELFKADKTREVVVTDASWQTSPDGLGNWVAATLLGKLGVQPWGAVALDRIATPAESLTVLPGFKVELVRSSEAGEGSWVSLTVDPKGRLIVSPQGGEPMLRFTLDGAGKVAKVEPIKLPVSGAMGLLCEFGALYANAQGPDGYHFYRLTDSDGDDQYDKVELLRRWQGGPGEHGAHGIVKGPDNHLYIINGNFVDVPTDLAPTSRVKNYADDLVLPRMEDGNGFGAGRKPPGGYVLRVDRDGRNPELFAAGQRNTYDLAFSPEGELFGFDSDMEWDWGTPWYRPTRVYQIVSGGDQGFREGSAKWPEYYEDSLPARVNIGIGSPTGVRFGTGAKFPAKYQRALYVLDWSYGRILAVHLDSSSEFKSDFEPLVKGKPLNVTDVEIGQDGAMYFTTGGRGTQAGLYRVSYVGTESVEPTKPRSKFTMNVLEPTGQEKLHPRSRLEVFHRQQDPRFVAEHWASLGSPTRQIRFAARVALENQPVATWADKALAETNSTTGLTALLALARVGGSEYQMPLLKTLARWPLDSLNHPDYLLKLRVIEVSFARHGIPEEMRARALEKLSAQFPSPAWVRNRELVQLLVALDAPGVVAKALALRDAADTQEEQLHYQTALRRAKVGWTPELRRRYFAWFNRPPAQDGGPTYPAGGNYFISRSVKHDGFFNQWFRDVGLEPGNGASFDNFLKNLRQEAFLAVPDAEKAAIAAIIAAQQVASAQPQKQRSFMKEWKTDDLLPLLGEAAKGRNFRRGQEVFRDAQCAACHRFHGDGGAVGPDLTGIGTRYAPADVVKSLTEPSLVISEQYQALSLTLKNGDEVWGRLVGETDSELEVLTDALANKTTKVPKAELKERMASKISTMPEGLLNNFKKDEILDLLAYLQADGKTDAPAFQK